MRERTRAGATRLAIARACGFAAFAAFLVAPLAARAGMPLFLHDWIWSPFADRTLWTWHFALSSWSLAGFGEPNSAITVNPAAWLKIAPALFLDGRSSQLVYLFGCLAFSFAGVFRLGRRNFALAEPHAWLAVALFASTPFLFSKIASGQSSYWAAVAGFVWGVSFADEALAERSVTGAMRAATCFAIATLQVQFLVFAAVALAALTLVRFSLERLGLAIGIALGSCSLALPEVWFLAMRGPERGAAISPPYPFWQLTQSSSTLDAAAMLGYAAKYAERAVAPLPFATLPIVIAAFVASAFALLALVRGPSQAGFAFALFGFLGWAWIAGVNGPFAALWTYAFAHYPQTAFLREFYHGAILLALALALLAASGIAQTCRIVASIPSRFSALANGAAYALGVAICASLGYATWTFGLGRVLPAVVVPDHRATFARAAKPGIGGRIAFVPARQPIAPAGNDVGGNDGADWVDARETSSYEFYLQPMFAAAVDALHAGDPRGIDLLERMGCDALVVRSWLHSRAYRGASDETRAAAHAAGLRGTRNGDDIAYRLDPFPAVGTASRVANLPGDLRTLGRAHDLTYLDQPGNDATDAVDSIGAARPRAELGWVGRRDLEEDASRGGPGGPAYGIATTRAGAVTHVTTFAPNNFLVWAPSGITLDRWHSKFKKPTWLFAFILKRPLLVRADGPAAIYEISEGGLDLRKYPVSIIGRAQLRNANRALPWKATALLSFDPRIAVVVFRERFDPAWRLSGPGLEIVDHVRADGFANAWIVRASNRDAKTISIPISIEYGYQPLSWALLAVSFVAFAIIAVLGFVPFFRPLLDQQTRN